MVENVGLSDALATIISTGFILILIAGGIAGYMNNNIQPFGTPEFIKDLKEDKIKIGYIESAPPPLPDEITQMKREIEYLKLKKQLDELKAETTEPAVDTKLINDCIEALVALGDKKSVARSKANRYFVNNPETKTVDEFISGVFKV
jgi:hypothetical protein